VTELLARLLGVAGVVTGEDFTFGKGRGGNVQLLLDLGAQHGIEAEAVDAVLLAGERISSGRIREALQEGDPGAATHMLSRPFAIQGEVIHGDKRGRELGWPTANMELGNYLRPKYGIYAVRVTLDDNSEHIGVASLGVRPMFDPPKELLETVLFDVERDLYGRTIEVALHAFLRPEMKFESVNALKAQMDMDAEEARRLLG
jgi:riboflavin kinase/FMN adenylyltransferase